MNITTIFLKHISLSGRATRSKFWISFFISLVVNYLSVSALRNNYPMIELFFFVLSYVIILLPVLIKRLHDTGISGWYILFIIVINIICYFFYIITNTDNEKFIMKAISVFTGLWLLYKLCKKGDSGMNIFDLQQQ
jgi:uncharacterized membrane protein YhaH (DUF805 family)